MCNMSQLGFSTIKFESVIRSNEKYYYVRSNQCDIAHYCKVSTRLTIIHTRKLEYMEKNSSKKCIKLLKKIGIYRQFGDYLILL